MRTIARPSVLLLLALLAGCASTHMTQKAAVESEKARLQAEATAAKKKMARKPGDSPAPRAGPIKLGISAEQAKVAMGEPVRARKMTSFDGTYDLLEYDGKNLRFKNDRLIEIQYVR